MSEVPNRIVESEREGVDMVLLQMARRPVLTSASARRTAPCRLERHTTDVNPPRHLKEDSPLLPTFPFLSSGAEVMPGLPFYVFPCFLPSKFDSRSGVPGSGCGRKRSNCPIRTKRNDCARTGYRRLPRTRAGGTHGLLFTPLLSLLA